MSGFEVITITFSFILGLGVTHILRSIGYTVRERQQLQIHWIPISVASIVLLFQVQFWFALVIVDTLAGQWTWTIYGVLLALAITIFLSGATVLPPPGLSNTRNLIEDFTTRGKISLVFLAFYLVGWIVVLAMFWSPDFIHTVFVNAGMATIATFAYFAQKQAIRSVLHGMLIVIMIYGLVTVWTPPTFVEPTTGTSAQ